MNPHDFGEARSFEKVPLTSRHQVHHIWIHWMSEKDKSASARSLCEHSMLTLETLAH